MATDMLTREELDAYWAAGVLFPQRALTEDESTLLGSTIKMTAEELLEDGADTDVLSFRPWEGDVHPFEGPLEQLVTNKAILSAVQSILGNSVMLAHCDIYLKPEQKLLDGSEDRSVPWRWDFPHVPEGSDKAVTVWVSLTPSGPTNGGNQYVTGSHLTPLERGSVDPRHCVMRGDDWESFRNLPLQEATLNPGEFSLHHPCIIHGSDANGGETNLGIALRFFSTEAPQEMVGNKSGRPVIGMCDDGRFEPTSNFPIRWWDATEDAFNRNIRKSTRLSVTTGNTDAQGRVLSRDAMGIIEAIEVSLRQGDVKFHPAPLEGGRTSAWEPSETDQHRAATAITGTGIEQLLEESGLRILDAEGAWGLSWADRVGGWRALLDSLVFLGTQEELPVFELGSHTGPILLRPRRLSSKTSEILMDNAPIHSTALDLGLWLAHHVEALQSQPWGATFLLPPLTDSTQTERWTRTFSEGLSAADLKDTDWGFVVNCSGPAAVKRLPQTLETLGNRVRCLYLSDAEFAGALFQAAPKKRTYLAGPWEKGSLKTALSEAESYMGSLAKERGLLSFRQGLEGGWAQVPTPQIEGAMPERFRPEAMGKEGLDLKGALKTALTGLIEGVPCHVLDAYRAQHVNWVHAGAQLSNGERLSPDLYTRTLRNSGVAEGWSPRHVSQWRTWVLSGTDEGSHPCAYDPVG